ncbi:unnamed protein product [Coregonus sp. 'balchen']|nr:unnamed protein product [Coregonus sp. 'balchen']
MSERSQSPISDCNSRPDDFSRPMYAQALSQEGFGGTSLQIPHGVLQHHSLLFNKTAYNGMPPTTPQTFFQFPPVGGDYRASDLQAGDFCQPKHWYPIAAPEYTGQVPRAAVTTQATHLSPPIAEAREQMKMPEIKIEKDVNDEYEAKIQQYPTPSSAVAHGVYYSTPWNPSFWPGLPHITAASSNTQNLNAIPSTSSSTSPSLSPSPPSNGVPGITFNGSASQGAQAQTSTRSNGSSSGGCSDSEEEENPSTEELELFAKELKHTRITLGFTQADVGMALGNLYGEFNMCKLKPLLRRWLNEAETSDNPQDMYKIERVFVDTRKRKRRTSLEGSVRTALESYFVKCPKPNTQEITHIADDLCLERDVVRVWFCNRRQKGKRLALPFDEECEGQYYEQSPPPPHMTHSPLPGQGYHLSSHPGPPTFYMPPLQRPDVFKQALHPGLVGHLTS